MEIARPHDLAILVYTSGTTGPPKGAMLSHQNIIFQLGYADFIAEPRPGDQQLSFLPLSHVAERTFTVFFPLRTGATVNFAESIDTVPENIREVAPAVFFAVPRIWEKFYSGVALRMREATPDRQARVPLGDRRSGRGWPSGAWRAGRPSLGLRLLYRRRRLLRPRQHQALAGAAPHARARPPGRRPSRPS